MSHVWDDVSLRPRHVRDPKRETGMDDNDEASPGAEPAVACDADYLRECEALVKYIGRYGDVLGEADTAAFEELASLVTKCRAADAVEDDWARLVGAYAKVTRLTRAAHGVNGRSVRDTLAARDEGVGWGVLFGGIPKHKRPLRVALWLSVSALALQVAEGLAALVGDPEVELGGLLYPYYGVKFLAPMLVPAVWGGLGACVFLMKQVSDRLAAFTYEEARLKGYGTRVLLGAIFGRRRVQWLFDMGAGDRRSPTRSGRRSPRSRPDWVRRRCMRRWRPWSGKSRPGSRERRETGRRRMSRGSRWAGAVVALAGTLCMAVGANAAESRPGFCPRPTSTRDSRRNPKSCAGSRRSRSVSTARTTTTGRYADTLRTAEWVAQHVKRTEAACVETEERPDRWFTERDLFVSGIAPNDDSYLHSGFDRGHLAPKILAARLGAAAEWNTHTVLNAVPQRARFNRQPWRRLERTTGAWAQAYCQIWVMQGPVFDTGPRAHIGDEGEREVAIPDALYKIVVRRRGWGAPSWRR